MAGETVITIKGNLGSDVDLRFTPSGKAAANFTVASTPRTFNRQTNEWVDGETLWMRCTAWGDMAENAAETLAKGMRVIVEGRLVSRSWDDKETGQRRTALEMQVDDVGPSLRYATAKVNRTQRGDGGGGGFSGQGGQQRGGQQGQGDPWAAPQSQQGGWGQQADNNDLPPF